jgi:hypothetical protein
VSLQHGLLLIFLLRPPPQTMQEKYEECVADATKGRVAHSSCRAFPYQTFVLKPPPPTHTSAIELQEDYFKAYARRATANEKLEHYETALEGASAPRTLIFRRIALSTHAPPLPMP